MINLWYSKPGENGELQYSKMLVLETVLSRSDV